MAKKTSLGKIKTPPKEKVPTKTIFCTGCDETKETSEFYKSYNKMHKTGVLPYCKACIRTKALDEEGKVDKETFVELLKQIDRPFLSDIFDASLDQSDTPIAFVGFYMKNIAMPQYRTLAFKDSVFEEDDFEEVIDEKKGKKSANLSRKDRYKLTNVERTNLSDKWGDFNDEELYRFEKTYQQMAKGYQIHTVLHQEALITYCKFSVLQNIAIEKNNIQEAKMYGDMAQKARTDAKLNPNQLTKNDIQVGGVDSFAQIADLVAKRDGLINIPMTYIKKPQDILDWQMLENVNYMRSSLNMPELEYEDMNAIYLNRIDKFNERYGADIMNNDFGSWGE